MTTAVADGGSLREQAICAGPRLLRVPNELTTKLADLSVGEPEFMNLDVDGVAEM